MNVLVLAGSPRKRGNSDTLLECVVDGIKSVFSTSVTKFYVNDLKILPCQACGGCDKNGCCVIDDDMKSVYENLIKTSILVVGSPLFFNNLSAQLKTVIDRCQCHWQENFILKSFCSKTCWPRRGVFVSTRGQKGLDIFKYPEKTIKAFFKNENIEYTGNLFVDSVDEKGAVQKYPEYLEKAFSLGEKTAKLF